MPRIGLGFELFEALLESLLQAARQLLEGSAAMIAPPQKRAQHHSGDQRQHGGHDDHRQPLLAGDDRAGPVRQAGGGA